MKLFPVASWLSFSFLPLSVLSTSSTNDQILLPSAIQIRNATISDAEAITNIFLSAFHDTAHFRYGYQFMDDYPQDLHNCLYNNFREALKIADVLVQLALLPNITAPHDLTPIAVALWVLPTAWIDGIDNTPSHSLTAMAYAGCKNLAGNETRLEDWEKQFLDCKYRYLDSVYDRKYQLYLNMLGTDPAYQRRGAGGTLLQSGLNLGSKAYDKENVTATLIATVAGEPLYAHTGWESMHNFTIKSLDVIDGKREEWRFDVMKHDLNPSTIASIP